MRQLSDEARTAVAMHYLDQSGTEIPIKTDDLDMSSCLLRDGDKWRERRNEARTEWLKQRASDNEDNPEPAPARMFHIGSGYVKLTVAVFCFPDTQHPDEECYNIMEEWIRQHRQDELNEEGELDEVIMETIPDEVEPPE